MTTMGIIFATQSQSQNMGIESIQCEIVLLQLHHVNTYIEYIPQQNLNCNQIFWTAPLKLRLGISNSLTGLLPIFDRFHIPE